MHGIVFIQFRKFVDLRLGPNGWAKIAADAKLGPSMYLAVGSYPDDELMKLVGAASRTLDIAVPDLVEAFGVFLAPSLIEMYRAHVKPEWGVLDFLEHVEGTMHTAVRGRDQAAAPPRLEPRRVSPTRVVLRYASRRRLCSLARGLVRGVSRHYGEAVIVKEPQCMLTGAAECVLEIDLDPTRTTGAHRPHRP